MKLPILIGLHGKPRVGKDTLADYLIDKYRLLRYGPSKPCKDATAAIFNIPRWWLDDNELKEKYDERWGMTVRQMAQKVGHGMREMLGDDIWLRHVEHRLQAIDTDPICTCNHSKKAHGPGCKYCDNHELAPAFRCLNYQPDPSKVCDYKGMILTDIRYENEVEWVKRNGGDVIFIIRGNAPKSSDQGHIIDAGLPADLADMLIYNNGTIEELYAQADKVMAGYYSF